MRSLVPKPKGSTERTQIGGRCGQCDRRCARARTMLRGGCQGSDDRSVPARPSGVKGKTMSEDLGVLTGGHRRIDRLLGEDHDLLTLGMDELRQLRADAEQEETDVSYLRRLLQGRIDIVEAEQAGRRGESSGDLVSNLARILPDDGGPAAPRGMGRHSTLEPSRADEHRRHVEALVADIG